MKLVKKTGLMTAGFGLVMMSQVSLAAPPTEVLACSLGSGLCQVEFSGLCTAIDEAWTENGGSISLRDRNGMTGKVNEADDKLDVGKFEDADQKLGDIGTKLDLLYDTGTRKQKISHADFTAISSALGEAHDCVADLMTP